ncbi:MAG: phenylalanine--tRNA ligase subunit alpha [Xanthomonadales bacterium]|nr:phenylalanine--tRNA ligase subunit alpha [Xanthomonadales bacterium]
MEQVDDIVLQAREELASCENTQRLEEIRVHYLGRRGRITELLKTLGSIEPDQRREFGQAVNAAKKELSEQITVARARLEAQLLEQQLAEEQVDVTLPGRGGQRGGLHPVTLAMQRIIDLFGHLGFDVATGPEVEDDYYNFESLNFPAHHPARAMHDTFYFGDGRLLRTHTSPVQIREMQKRGAPIRIIAPGKVYRSDYDQTHTPMFHQVEGLLIGEKVSMADLKGILREFVNAYFESEMGMRFRPSYFPFTEPSAEVDIAWDRGDGSEPGWLEILGCGMVHPNVLKACDVDSERYIGYAFGMGVERLAMLRYGVTDLRQFFENDLQFLRQFR